MFRRDRLTGRGVLVVLLGGLGLIGLGESARLQAAGASQAARAAATAAAFRSRTAAAASTTAAKAKVSSRQTLPSVCSCCCASCHGGKSLSGSTAVATSTQRPVPVSTGTPATPSTTKAVTPSQSSTTASLTNTTAYSNGPQQARLSGYLSGGTSLTGGYAQAWLSQYSGYGPAYVPGGYLPGAVGGGGLPVYANPYPANASDGAADLIEAEGNYLVSEQQAALLQEQARQRRIDTRRRAFDQWLYERQHAPTWEDDRERLQATVLRRSRTELPPTEVVSARALNALLDHLQKVDAAATPSDDVPLDEAVVARVNVTCGRGGHVGLLKDGGRLRWPKALADDAVRAERGTVDSLLGEALAQAASQPLGADAIGDLNRTTDRLRTYLAGRSRDLPAKQYMEAKRFLDDLGEALTALQRPDAKDYVARKYAARGRTVTELVRSMTQQGLHFAPASQGDEDAYLALHRALAAYDSAVATQARR